MLDRAASSQRFPHDGTDLDLLQTERGGEQVIEIRGEIEFGADGTIRSTEMKDRRGRQHGQSPAEA